MGCSSVYSGTEVTAQGELSNMRLGRTVQLVLTLSVRYLTCVDGKVLELGEVLRCA